MNKRVKALCEKLDWKVYEYEKDGKRRKNN